MVLIGSVIDLIVLGAAGRWVLPHVLRFLEAHGQVEPNYIGRPIPRGLGLVLWLLLWLQELALQVAVKVEAVVVASSISLMNTISYLEMNTRIFTLSATVIFLLGWTDDLIGSKAVKGLKGHYRHWVETKTFSMGAVKAVGTLAVSVWLVLAAGKEQTPIWQMGAQLVLLMLMTNTLNLLDVRPGRSLKVFLGGTFGLLLLGLFSSAVETKMLFPMIPIFIGGLLLYGLDIRGSGMLGDAGANLLGFTLGYGMITILPWVAQIVIVAVICYLHKLAEVSSISERIERNRFLHWLDRLGRT